VRQRDFEVTMGNITAFAPGAMAQFLETTSSLNLARHSDTQVDELFQQWRTTAEPTAHAQATERLQAYLADKLYLAGLANTPFFHGVRNSVKGYTFIDKLHLHFEAAWLER
jgi:ABC-type transport system substrate-binding protein